MAPDVDDFTTCVRRFGRRSRGPSERRGYEHVTGARVSATNGHEVIFTHLLNRSVLTTDAKYRFFSVSNVYKSAFVVATDWFSSI
jgi:hypothetical protein